MTIEELETALDPLVGLKFRPPDYRTHWAGLKDMPVEALRRAVERAAKQCVEFPTPSELRTLADASGGTPMVFEDRSVPLEVAKILPAPFLSKPLRITREWIYYCEVCNDEGWQSMWCGTTTAATWKPWQAPMTCGRHGEHEPHEWVQRCACIASNPAIQQRKERDAKFAAQRSERKSA